VIIGGGIIGLCAAYYASRRGHQMTVLERAPELNESCSFGNAGMVVPSHFIPLAAPGMVALGLRWMWNPKSPFYIKPRLNVELWRWAWRFLRAANAQHVRRSAPLLRDLHLASRACFEELAAIPNLEFGLSRRGLLMLCRTQHALHEELATAEQARELGIPAQPLDPKELAAREPGITMNVAGAVYFPKDCHLNPGSLIAGLRRELAGGGVRFSYDCAVAGFVTDQNRITAVRTNQGEIRADEFVVCGGAWSAQLGRELGLNLLLQAGKGYSLTLTKPPQLPQTCAILTEARVAVTPMGASLRFGGTMELAGLNEGINQQRLRGIIESVPAYYPGFTAEHFADVRPWSGLRPCSPDGLPYLGRSSRYENLVVATGHAMMGLSLGPVTGKIVADLLSGDRPGFDLALLDPDRFA
jgi:D-amino-acid dehydrogenase